MTTKHTCGCTTQGGACLAWPATPTFFTLPTMSEAAPRQNSNDTACIPSNIIPRILSTPHTSYNDLLLTASILGIKVISKVY